MRTRRGISLAFVLVTLSLVAGCGSGVDEPVLSAERDRSDAEVDAAAPVEDPVATDDDDGIEAAGGELANDEPHADEVSLSEWGIGMCEATLANRQPSGVDEPTITDGDHPGEEFADVARERAGAFAGLADALEALGTPPTPGLRDAGSALIEALRHDAPLLDAAADRFDAVEADSNSDGHDDEEDAIEEITDGLDSSSQMEQAWEAILASEDLALGEVILHVTPSGETTPAQGDDHERELIRESDACGQLMMSFMRIG